MSEQNKYCVYLHRRTDNNVIFYIGQGAANRPGLGSRKLKAWTKTVKESGGFTFEIIVNNLSKTEALKLETFYIEKYKDTVVNLLTSSSKTKELVNKFTKIQL